MRSLNKIALFVQQHSSPDWSPGGDELVDWLREHRAELLEALGPERNNPMTDAPDSSDYMVTSEVIVPAQTRQREWRWVVRYQPVLGATGPEPQPDWHPTRKTRVMYAWEDEAEAWNALRSALKVAIERGEHTPDFDPRVGYVRKFGRWEAIESGPAENDQVAR